MIREFEEHPLRGLNSFHADEKARRLVVFDAAEDLDHIFSPESGLGKFYVLGGGNNILFTGYFDGALLKPDIRGIHVLAEDDEAVTVEAGAAVEWDDLVAWSVERGLWGAENLSLIPGTVGAAPVQNIGAYGAEAKDVIARVHLFDTERREHKVLAAEECRFAYRDSIFKHELRGRAVITSVEFRFGKRPAPDLGYGDLQRETEARGGASLRNIREAVCAIRRGKLPDTAVLGNAGSFFKNPVVSRAEAERLAARYEGMPVYPVPDPERRKLAAGWLIDRAGMKGYRKGRAGVHDRQALVLVNFGGATGEEIMELAREVQLRVRDAFGVAIEPEVNIL
ncbi:UDP-N-acetylmuramate dehydrogenase [Alistipes sp. Z76]|nr:UDP-N-acetylmuramate dehydrogenase [Alistipes sp. Z76]NCE70177.1 UDP-N-acetylmuramate dehydrogenase [Muribaculaceae bacterium M3]